MKGFTRGRAARAALTAAAWALASCGGGDADSPDPQREPAVVVHPPVEGPPVAAEGEISAGRGVRRMKLDELAASVSVVAGKDDKGEPIQWTVQRAGTYMSGFDDLGYGHVLGRPDYVSTTEEAKAPSSLELKFMRDMARDVCDRMVRADLARAPSDEKTLLRHVRHVGPAQPDSPNDAEDRADVKKNAQYLVLRFHGLRLGLDDPQLIALVRLYEHTRDATEHPELHEVPAAVEGWRAVCIALFEDPAFYLD